MSLPQSVLPRCVGIINEVDDETKFLYVQGGHPRTKREDYLEFGFTNSGSHELKRNMHTRFLLDPSKEHHGKGDEELFHVRCAYNNKYLVAKEVMEKDRVNYKAVSLDEPGREVPNLPKVSFLFDVADEPEEDLSKSSCTLFRIRVQKSDNVDRLRSIGRHHRVSFVHPESDEKVAFLTFATTWTWERHRRELSLVYHDVILLDLSEQTILPPYVAFKIVEGEDNFYLKVFDDDFLKFSSTDITDKSVRFMTFNYDDGSVRLKSLYKDRFLKFTDDHNRIKAVGTITDDNTLFKALKYGNFFALQALHKNKGNTFCTCSKDDWLAVGEESITSKAKFMLEEPVLSREIYNVQYHANHHSRVYDTTNMNMATVTATNSTSENNTIKSSVSITTKEASKWEATATHKGSIQMTFHAGFALKLFDIIDAEFGMETQYGYEFSHATTWGTSSEVEKKQEIEYEVTVPANKRVILTVTATQAQYDVPFSYTQKDTLLNGEVVIDNYDDGLYTGMNCFDLRYDTREEDIKTDETKENNKTSSSKKRKESR